MQVQSTSSVFFFSVWTASNLSEVTTPKNRSVYQGSVLTSNPHKHTHTHMCSVSGFQDEECQIRRSYDSNLNLVSVKCSVALRDLLNCRGHCSNLQLLNPTWILPDLLHKGKTACCHFNVQAMVVKHSLTHVNPLPAPIQKKPNAAELNTHHKAHSHIHTHTLSNTHQSWYNRVIMYKMTSFLCICGPDCIRKYELTQSETPPNSRRVLLQVTAQRLCLL